MKTFTDNAGRTWTLALTVDSLKRVKGLAEVDLANVLLPRPNQEVPLLVELEEDLLLFSAILFALVQPQAAQTGVSQEEFDRDCGGAVLADADADADPPSLHECRSLAARMYDAQGVRDVQTLLGHSHASMTELYKDDRGLDRRQGRWKVVSLG